MAKRRCRKVKSGPRKGRCKLKRKAKRGGKRRHTTRAGNFCVKVRGKKRSVKCYRSVKAALRAKARLERSGVQAVVKGSGKMV